MHLLVAGSDSFPTRPLPAGRGFLHAPGPFLRIAPTRRTRDGRGASRRREGRGPAGARRASDGRTGALRDAPAAVVDSVAGRIAYLQESLRPCDSLPYFAHNNRSWLIWGMRVYPSPFDSLGAISTRGGDPSYLAPHEEGGCALSSSLERVMNSGENRISMRFSPVGPVPSGLRFPHS